VGTSGAASRQGPLVPATELRALAVAVLEAIGTPPESAAAVADSLVEANLTGHDSHGVRRLLWYLDAVRAGKIDPAARPYAERLRRATVLIHGRQAFGQLAARLAVDELRRLTATNGVAVAVVERCFHVGRLGEYVGALAESGLAAMALCNADPTVAPFGGRERRLGTNPMAWAVPRAPDRAPVVVDWATSAVAEGKLAVARSRGETVAPGVVLDREGRPTADPEDFYHGGALLPFGEHKGYGLSVIIEALGGLLSGAGISCLPGYDDSNGTVMVALDIATFLPIEVFRARVEDFCAALAATPTAAGHDEVLVPGELEDRSRRQRGEHGVPMPEQTWRELRQLLADVTRSSDHG
jgi:LDH2 family malate/lactate/ureidoglycolate dehydrogenase